MKKSTIITIVAFVLGIIILGTGFVLLTDNNISKKFRELMNKTTASTTTTTTTKPPRDTYEPMDLFKEDISKYVTLGDYKNMIVETEQIEASDEEVDMQISIILAIQKEFTKIREGNIGEKVIFSFDFTGYLTKEDGTKDKAFDGGAGTDQLAYIDGDTLYTLSSQGVGTFIPGFAEGMLNAKVGDTLDLNITFPEDYHSADLKGKKTIFEVKINYIAKLNFTDGWVKEYTKEEQKTCDEYREYIKGLMNDMVKDSNTELLWSKITENAIINIPKQQFDYLYYNYRYQIEDYAAMLNMSYEDFFKSGYVSYLLGINLSTDAELINYVNDNLKYQLIMLAIIQAEDIKATDEEYDIMLETLVEQTGKTEEEVLKQYSEEYIRQQIVLNKIDDVVYDLNDFVLKTEE